MDSTQYLDKLNDLLADAETYEKMKPDFTKEQSVSFNPRPDGGGGC